MTPPVTVVGAGVAGANIAAQLLQQGRRVRVIDAGVLIPGSVKSAERPHAQMPWGWVRRVSLQCHAKLRWEDITEPLRFCTPVQGPMLVTTDTARVRVAWEQWLAAHPRSDAHILSARESESAFGVRDVHATFVCDSRDFVMDFRDHLSQLWDHLARHPDCEVVTGRSVTAVGRGHLTLDGVESVPAERVVVAMGSRTRAVVPWDVFPPSLHMQLPYQYTNTPVATDVLGLWNRHSTLTQVPGIMCKVAAGNQGIVPPSELLRGAPFAGVATRTGVRNLHLGGADEQRTVARLVKAAFADLSRIIGVPAEACGNHEPEACTIDATPSFCPYVFRYNGALVVTGFSGAGTLALQPWFLAAVARSACADDGDAIDAQLHAFLPAASLPRHWFPDQSKMSPLTSV